ncbi:MAG: SGNH/GDSL hydrolase family protein, partial [Tannerellaceae bacterium]
MKLTNLLVSLTLSVFTAGAQTNWHSPMNAGFPTVQNQGWTSEIGQTYSRLPDRAQTQIRPDVWSLSRNSAGLAIHFYSNAPKIQVRYTVSGGHSMPHMPATGVSGIDLYATNSDGEERFCFGDYSFGDTIRYSYNNIGKDRYHNRGFEYHLYLPLYNSVKWMEIGIPEGCELQFLPQAAEKPVVLYGTSIAQGACASRPGMAWGNILQRALDYPLINLGFSGNGRLEKEMLQYITEIDARLYLLDCLPNLPERSEEEIAQLVKDAVKQIRQTRTAPILLIDHAGYSNAG